jgi:transposase
MLKNIDPETYKKGPNDVTRFIKRTSATKDGEKAEDSYKLDLEKIAEEEKYDGFYALATNVDASVNEILEISSNRYKIEDCFRVMKTNLDARPIYHRKRERIKAHFLICYTSLLIYRLLETKLKRFDKHCTTDNIIDTLKKMDVVNVENMYYLSTYTGSKTCTALNAVFDIGLDKKYYKPKELNKKSRNL